MKKEMILGCRSYIGRNRYATNKIIITSKQKYHDQHIIGPKK